MNKERDSPGYGAQQVYPTPRLHEDSVPHREEDSHVPVQSDKDEQKKRYLQIMDLIRWKVTVS